MDANAIDALLLATLQDHSKYRELVKRRDRREAQFLLNLLQAVGRVIFIVCHFVTV